MPMHRRLPPLAVDDLNQEQLKLWNAVASVTARERPPVDSDGHLLGHYDPLLRSPEVGQRLSDLGIHLRVVTEVPRRFQVLAILTVGAHWHSDFIWRSWSPAGHDQDLDEAGLESIREGRVAAFGDVDDQLIYSLTQALLTTGTVTESLFAQAQNLVGDAGLVELFTLIGYYGLVAFFLNGFGIPLPEGESYVWAVDP
jgi:4-carboxymuconolactone decarboxylase